MPKPLEELIIEEEIRRLELEIAKLEGVDHLLPRRIDECEDEVMLHKPFHEGPEYLTVVSSLWDKPYITLEDGTPLKCLDDARCIARKRGLKGISIVTKGSVNANT